MTTPLAVRMLHAFWNWRVASASWFRGWKQITAAAVGLTILPLEQGKIKGDDQTTAGDSRLLAVETESRFHSGLYIESTCIWCSPR